VTNSLTDGPEPERRAIPNNWLSGHPIIDPKHKEPDVAPVRDEIVKEAVQVMAAFGGDVRCPAALSLLPMWRHFRTLSIHETQAVLDHFPKSKPRNGGTLDQRRV
jgi:hypothetical protein